MYPAMAWDMEGARAWTVMGRLRERQERLRNDAIQARRRVAERDTKSELHPAALAGAERDLAASQWHGEPVVIALLFAHRDSVAMRMLDARRAYFDQRSGDTWDLFFPGYYHRSPDKPLFEDRIVGPPSPGAWAFNESGFDIIRSHVASESGDRWKYSGGADLVLIPGNLPEQGEPEVDWNSTLSGQLTDPEAGIMTLTLGEVVERISLDVGRKREDLAYGVGGVVGAQDAPARAISRDLVINALGGIISALAARELGI